MRQSAHHPESPGLFPPENSMRVALVADPERHAGVVARFRDAAAAFRASADAAEPSQAARAPWQAVVPVPARSDEAWHMYQVDAGTDGELPAVVALASDGSLNQLPAFFF